MSHYFASDGNYGDATDLVVVHTDDWTSEDWDRVLDTTDNDRLQEVNRIIESKSNPTRVVGL